MEDKKRKKSGHEFRMQKKSKDLEESAKACSKITKFYKKPLDKDSETPILFESSNQDTSSLKPSSFIMDSEGKTANTVNSFICLQQSTQSDSAPNNTAEVSSCFTLPSSSKNLIPVPVLQNESESQPQPSKLGKESEIEFTEPRTFSETIDYFIKPNREVLPLFFSFHPIQPNERDLPFVDKKPLFNGERNDKQTFNRQWLTYNEKKQLLFCSVCLAFSNGNSVFCSGFKDWKHVHQRVMEHEVSKTHIDCVTSFMAIRHKKSTFDLLFVNQIERRKQEVRERRHILEIIINVLKLIGKQGLAFRGSVESAYTLDEATVNHGNFLEIVLLLGKYDSFLEKHLKKVIAESKRIHDREVRPVLPDGERAGNKKTIGRGSHVTFLSKTTITKIIQIIRDEIKTRIAEDVKKASNYSVLIDTTVDIGSNDQCAMVIRYVKDCEVFERLFALKCVISTTGENLFNSLRDALEEVQIPIENCVANAFDGAANMSGQYKGVTAKLSDMIPNHIHTWCYAHVLNLVLSDTAQCLSVTITFFNLLQETQVFLKESLKRLQIFFEENPKVMLEAIGTTRWRSRSDATVKIFGRIDDWTGYQPPRTTQLIYIELIIALFKISTSSDFNSKVRNDAEALLQKFTSFETILVAMMFLQIFKITTPLSDYLQTKNLDYVQAWRLVESSLSRLKTLRDRFSETLNATKNFISINSAKLDERAEVDSFLEDLMIETEPRKKRQKKVKRLPGEIAEHENVGSTPEDIFRITVFNCVMDTIVQTIENRFINHRKLYLDLAWFDPKRFTDINETLPSQALDRICEVLPSVDKGKLKEELISFAKVWPQISRKPSGDGEAYEEKTYNTEEEFDGGKDEDEEENQAVFAKCDVINECNSCIKCALKILNEYNMYALQYTELYKVYKFLLTLPLTQVTCERVFSKVKFIKNRLRSCMTNNNLEALVLMQSEKDILITIDNDLIINKLCEFSSEMRRLLAF